MARKGREDKIASKRLELIKRTAAALAVNDAEAERLLSVQRKQSLRANTLKIGREEVLHSLKKLGWVGEQYSWMPEGFTIDSGHETVRDSELVANGQVFIQNAASWLPVLGLDPRAGEQILDVCSAPGGKTSHIAAMANNQAHIWANDNSRARLIKLRANLERLGAKTEQLTLFDATQLVRKLGEQQFDKILLDAPCSGEGMMHLQDNKALATWSVAQIKRLQQLQKRLIGQAWQLLKPGGTLVYSTCTIAPEENEAVIDYLLRHQPEAVVQPIDIKLPNQVQPAASWNNKTFNSSIQNCLRLAPSENIEAFFVCKIRKSTEHCAISTDW